MKGKILTLVGMLAFLAFIPSTTFAGSCSKDIVTTASQAGNFKTLLAAAKAAGLVGALKGHGPLTVFAPTDEAFAKLPKGTLESLLKPENKTRLQNILKYHVVSGKISLSDALKVEKAKTLQGDKVSIDFNNASVKINSAKLLAADIKTSNGVIHVIDSVLLPPKPKNNIPGIAKKAGKFNTLLAAAEAAGLVPALSGNDKLTVLAPTDEAFAKLPKGTIESLLRPVNKNQLQEILKTHVIKGSVLAGTALNAGAAKSINHQDLAFSIKDGLFKVNNATILTTDIKADNGIIHVIDAVILPKPGNAMKTKGDLSKMIKVAINKGVPVFNHGNPSKCSEIYSDCLQAMIGSKALTNSTRQHLEMVMKQAKNTHCDSSRAWILRKGLDQAYMALSN